MEEVKETLPSKPVVVFGPQLPVLLDESKDLNQSGFELLLSQKIVIPEVKIVAFIGKKIRQHFVLGSRYLKLQDKLTPGSYQCNFVKIKKEHFITANDALTFFKRRGSLFLSMVEFVQLRNLKVVFFPKDQKIILLNEITMLEEDGYENVTVPIVIFKEEDSIGVVYKSNFEQQYNDEYVFLEILPITED